MGTSRRGSDASRAAVESLEKRTLMCNPGDYYDVGTGRFVTGDLTQSLIDQTASQPVPAHQVKVIDSRGTTARMIGPQMLVASEQPSPQQIGAFTGTFDFTDNATHVSLLPNGHVMWWAVTSTTSQLWNPYTNTHTDASRPDIRNYQLFCSGHSILPDGRLFITGGQILNSNADGAEQAVIYDASTGEFIYAPDMKQRRWYPTNTTLPDGTVLVVSGRFYVGDQPGATYEYDIADLPQIYNPKTNTWRDLTTATRRQALYPWMFVAPDGRVFDAGPSKRSYWLDTTGTGKWTAGPSQIYGSRDYGSAVMYAPGKILVMGGTDTGTDGSLGFPTATAEIIDLNEPNPQWKSTGSMSFARRQHTATVLPDGRVLVTGGTGGPGFNAAAYNGVDVSVYQAEIWDPATGQWTVLDAMHERRLYHSSALLMPDGRVLVAGGGDPMGSGYINGQLADPTKHTTAEYYEPDYLFKSARPTIASASNVMRYNTTYTLESPDAASIVKVALIRNGSMTHDFNADQRYVPLSFTVSGNRITITTPIDPVVAPAGPYMLFILNAEGVPSSAQIVSLGVHGQEIPVAAPNTGTISGLTFNDVNANGIFDTGDAIITGRTVFLDANNNNTLDTGERSTTTDSNGRYSFANLGIGLYSVRRVFPKGYVASNTPWNISLSAAQNVTDVNIGSVIAGTIVTPPGQEPPSDLRNASITGHTYNDNNANGVFDAGDAVITGKTVFLDTNNNGKLDTGEKSVTSNASGVFTFTALAAGTYYVRRVFPTGYKASNPPRDYTLTPGQVISGADIGSVRSSTIVIPGDGTPPPPPPPANTGSISGMLFWDTNRNAAFDPGEAYQSAKTVFIDLDDDNILDSNEARVTSDSQGRFTFSALAAGTYIIKRVVPKGYTVTTPKQVITLTAGQVFSGVAIGTNTL